MVHGPDLAVGLYQAPGAGTVDPIQACGEGWEAIQPHKGRGLDLVPQEEAGGVVLLVWPSLNFGLQGNGVWLVPNLRLWSGPNTAAGGGGVV